MQNLRVRLHLCKCYRIFSPKSVTWPFFHPCRQTCSWSHEKCLTHQTISNGIWWNVWWQKHEVYILEFCRVRTIMFLESMRPFRTFETWSIQLLKEKTQETNVDVQLRYSTRWGQCLTTGQPVLHTGGQIFLQGLGLSRQLAIFFYFVEASRKSLNFSTCMV